MPSPATEVRVARYGPVIRAWSSRLGGHQHGQVEGVEDGGQDECGHRRRHGRSQQARPGGAEQDRQRPRRDAAPERRPDGAGQRDAEDGDRDRRRRHAPVGREYREVLLDGVQAADERDGRHGQPQRRAAQRLDHARPAAAARPRRRAAAGPPGSGSRAPRPPGRPPRSPSRPARTRRGRTARSPRTPSAPAPAAPPRSSSRTPGRTSPSAPTAASSSWISASLAPETSAPPTPQITKPTAKAQKPGAAVHTTKATACRTDARTTAPRRDQRSASAPAGTSVTSAVTDQMREQHRDLRVGQPGVEEQQRVERVVRHQLGQRGPAHGQPGERPCGRGQSVGRRTSTERHAGTMDGARASGNR